MTVQASSICVLPYTCAGSRPESITRLLNFTTEYRSKPQTTTNMTEVTASTNMDKPKMVFAGVDAGAKMFVELTGGPGTAAAPIARKPHNNKKIQTAVRGAELCWCRISHRKRVPSSAVCLAVLEVVSASGRYLK